MDNKESEAQTPPLMRHPTLRPLSREHMGGLIEARALMRAADEGLLERVGAVMGLARAWQMEIAEHFADEERMLLPLIGEGAMGERLVAEHAVLRELAARCVAAPQEVAAEAATVGRLGRLLHDHIRWEERVLFEAVQRTHPEALAAMEDAAAELETRRPGARARARLAEPE